MKAADPGAAHAASGVDAILSAAEAEARQMLEDARRELARYTRVQALTGDVAEPAHRRSLVDAAAAAEGAAPAVAEADAEAARVYAQSFGKDAQFYNFYRAMQAYRTTFVGDEQNPAGRTAVILSPNDDFLEEFSGRNR